MKAKNENFRLPITAWAKDDRPREKLLLRGRHMLSDAELLAIIIGSGSRNESAVELCKRILRDSGNSLDQLARLSINELKLFTGMGEAKALAIIAALEIGRRRTAALQDREETFIRTSADSWNLLRSELEDLDHEQFWVILLNRANRLIRKELVSKGGVNSTVVDPKVLYRLAIAHGASSMVVAHNHPSGSIKPSESDIRLTRRLREASIFMEIGLLDHIIVGTNSYFSFADDGIL
jgi:DNA repair protein RadC